MNQALIRNSGQVMLLTVLVVSGTILGATTIAGMLTLNQLRQANNISLSTQALFAADAGIEWELFKFFKPEIAAQDEDNDGLLDLAPQLTNNTCLLTSSDQSSIKSVGCAGGAPTLSCSDTACPRPVNRAFQIFLEEQSAE